ncbi:MAG: class I SAM-dependent methyltransferase [Bauldia sp.]|nr:class I SAM-dependent methyltransferase [Bauldia sp.]MCW5716644.1 class I SAM-dependent methyltransferase [Bauldia sp.]
MSLFPLERALRGFITHGHLTVIDTDGQTSSFGQGEPAVTIRIRDPGFKWRLLRRPSIEGADGYVDEAFSIEAGTLRDYLEIVLVSQERMLETSPLAAVQQRIGNALRRRNTFARSSRNVRHHYDIDQRLYDLFLDEDLQYSCAYWRDGVTSLEDAQRDKRRHVARKLLLQPGMRVVELGCGWGGLALHLAREHGVHVTAYTLSHDQHATAVRRAAEAGLADRVTFKLEDYRNAAGPYDRVVSVGMLEHIGLHSLPEFFRKLSALLAPDGIAVVHSICRAGRPGGVNPWIQRYVFPGAYLPSLSQLAPLIERNGLWLTDFESLRIHYAKTLAAWDERFQARRAEISGRFDERFCRMWEFYLQSCEVTFLHRKQVVFHLQMAKAIDTVPITRDYMYAPYHEATPAMTSMAASGMVEPGRRRTAKPQAETGR